MRGKYRGNLGADVRNFLSSPSDAAPFPYIPCITPPLSPALSSASPSPSTQIDGYNTNTAAPASFVEVNIAAARREHQVGFGASGCISTNANEGMQDGNEDAKRMIN